jgi:hypothetical protein
MQRLLTRVSTPPVFKFRLCCCIITVFVIRSSSSYARSSLWSATISTQLSLRTAYKRQCRRMH